MSYTSSKLAVRDSFDDDDVSDDVEDEVFIRDGRNGFKVDEERGVKRPLMAPRRKTKNQMNSEIGGRPPCRVFCAPCCYGFIALTALLGVIILVVSLVMWFPFPLDQMSKFWEIGKESLQGDIIIPCTELTVKDVWTTGFSKLTVESAVRLSDVNRDGALDVIIGHGTGADGHDVPDYMCKLYFDRASPCLGGLIALDGRTGATIWHYWTPHSVFTVDCSADLTDDNINDCLISGKGGVNSYLSSHYSVNIWQYTDLTDSQTEPLIDVYSAQFIEDVDGDGFPDILSAHTRDANPGETGTVLLGQLLLVSGKTGTTLQSVATPHREETYYPPQVLVQLDGVNIVLFGTGGQASPGGLYAVPLHHLIKGNMLQVEVLYHNEEKGVMSPAVLVDIDQDGSEDIVAAMFNSVVIAFNGISFKPLWNYTMPGTETFSAPTPGYFNDDNVPDFLVKYQDGPGFPVYYSSQTTVLNGRTGVPLLDKPVVDTVGSQMGALSISVEGLGNDFILYWTADCLHHEGSTKPYTFLPGTSVQAQSRADLCHLLFNSTLSTKFIALSEHVEPPGVTLYSSETRKEEEYNNSEAVSAQVHNYLETHPDFIDVYDINSKVVSNDKKEYEDDSSSFRHRAQDGSKEKGSGYFYNDASALNRASSEQEEMAAPDFQGNSELPNIRKHGSPVDKTWQVPQQEDGNVPMGYNFLMNGNSPSGQDNDYDMLYGEANNFLSDNEQNKRTPTNRNKREQPHHVHGLQRLTSLGALSAPLWPQKRNDSIDLLLVTHWIHPMHKAQLMLEKDKKCIQKKQSEAENGNGKYNANDDKYKALDQETILKECLSYKWQDPNTDLDSDVLSQTTVYRLQVTCGCRSVARGERCSSLLPFSQQNWPAFMGLNGNGHFKPRPS
ncbi:hypothetical protein L9F63_014126 [Diploptera punctata]|uniref:FAM234A/B beta-propeller domain-containing protein n=1 Tax=Diploptera punctata TaxID=6984 RepID=A0AAD8A8F8_DIPPU|nr:hypothetical protein L9F63_014126 [Diploptera punctata]